MPSDEREMLSLGGAVRFSPSSEVSVSLELCQKYVVTGDDSLEKCILNHSLQARCSGLFTGCPESSFTDRRFTSFKGVWLCAISTDAMYET